MKKHLLKKSITSILTAFIIAGVSAQTQTNVTFRVDMSQQTGFTTPEVNGTFNSWCGAACNPMADVNSDGIWEVTIPIASGSYEYKFATDNWTTQESLTAGSPCTVTSGQFTNRTLTVGTNDTILPIVCWNLCSACSAPLTNVTFRVDMNQQTGFTTPEVNGTFNSWCGAACNPMTDVNADGIWEVTVALTQGSYEYKFAADNWALQETLTVGSSCTITNGNFTNRSLVVGSSDTTLNTVCWGSCAPCLTNSILEIKSESLQIFPNPSNGILHINSATESNISIVNLLGEEILKMKIAKGDNVIEISHLPKGIYTVISNSNYKIESKRVTHQ